MDSETMARTQERFLVKGSRVGQEDVKHQSRHDSESMVPCERRIMQLDSQDRRLVLVPSLVPSYTNSTLNFVIYVGTFTARDASKTAPHGLSHSLDNRSRKPR